MEHINIVSPNPHRLANITTRKVMAIVLIALLPAVIASGIIFGGRAIMLIGVCVTVSVAAEYLCRAVMKRDQTIDDLSAAVTGLLLALNLPVTLPIWMAVIGCVVSVVIVKQLFGGLGHNFANPAITGRIVLMVSFPTQMTNWVKPFFYQAGRNPDLVTSPTPLGAAKVGESTFQYMDLFLGNCGGCLGEVSALALLLGGLILMGTGVIHWSTPTAFIGSVALLSWMGSMDPLYQILSGGLFLGAFFMATDYVTTPITIKGKWIFGLGCGIFTFLIRRFGSYPEGVSFSILLMNILTPYIDRITKTVPLGTEKPKGKEAAK